MPSSVLASGRRLARCAVGNEARPHPPRRAGPEFQSKRNRDTVSAVRRTVALAAAYLVALAAAGAAQAGGSSEFAGHHRQLFRVVVVDGLTTADLPRLARDGAAVGLLVPNAGPRTSASDALAGMVRGTLYNARLPKPTDSILIRIEHARMPPRHGPAIVLALPPQHTVPNIRRYPIAVLGRGYRGLLVSRLTRVPGLVSMADVARTALGTANRLRAQPSPDPAAALAHLESRIVAARSSTMAASVLVLALLVCFALLHPAGAPAAIGAALAANLALGWVGAGSAAASVTLLGLCTVAGGLLGARLQRSQLALGAALVLVVAAYAAATLAHPPALSLAPVGPELTSRFFGVSNVLETLLLAPALLAARLLDERLGPLALAGVGALALATIAENRLGADGGGALVVAVAFAVLAAGSWTRSRRVAVLALAAALLSALLLLDLDAASSSPDHLRGALDGGARGLAHVAANRVPLAYARMLEQWYLVFPGLATLSAGVAAARRARSRRDAALVASLLAGIGVSLLVNDSPGPVTLAGLAALSALEGGLLQREWILPLLRRALGGRLAPTGAGVASARPQE